MSRLVVAGLFRGRESVSAHKQADLGQVSGDLVEVGWILVRLRSGMPEDFVIPHPENQMDASCENLCTRIPLSLLGGRAEWRAKPGNKRPGRARFMINTGQS
jgi:hypothetical protein